MTLHVRVRVKVHCTSMSNTIYWENSQTVVFTSATNNTVIKLVINIEDNNLKATITWLNG